MTTIPPQHATYMTENACKYEVSKKSHTYENSLKEYLNNYGGVGASAVVIDQGSVNFFSCGKKSLTLNEKPSEKTLFEMGSITKVFTTFLLVNFVAEGKLKLDDPIETYFPSVAFPEFDGKKITFRHLATHHSGLPELPNNLKSKSLNPYKPYSIDDLKNFLSACHLESTPGETFHYSDIGMGLLGYILSQIEGKSYEELLSGYIFQPLGMEDSGISSDQKENLATGHALGNEVEYFEMAEIFQGAGALYSNTSDMAKFLSANMGFLETSTKKLLTTCHQFQGESFPTMGVGLGWLIAPNSNTGDIIWHSGKTGGFRSFLGFNTKTQKGVVILANSTEDWPRLLALEILNGNK